MSTKRFRVAFSFAGEKRDFVSKVADILADRFGKKRILYDKYYEAEFARARLGRYLPKLYNEESDLVVVVLSNAYRDKEWCGLEWDAIFDLLQKRQDRDVMLCRFDFANVDGLYSDAGYVELDEKSAADTAKLILARLKANGIDTSRQKRARKASDVDEAPTNTIPNNLPRIEFFFGRAEELKKIADALSPKTRTWGVLIDGPGGIGKTTLAVRAAEMAPRDQFQSVFFISSKERKLTAEGERKLSDFVTPGYLDMLNEIARLLKKPELAKQSETERARVVIEALAAANALLILDNLETMPRDQQDRLFEFLSQLPLGCKAIVTSRLRTDVDARIIRLAKLDQDAALALIDELANDRILLGKATKTERLNLYEETGGNPLLLRWIAGQLGKGRCRNIPSALDLLKEAAEDNDPLEFIFGDLLGTFTESETKVLAALTHFRQPIEVKLIAELANISSTAAATALGNLSYRALVIPDDEERRFALVPMVADFLRSKKPAVIAEAGGRLEQRAFTLITENGYQNYDRFHILDAAWSTVSPAFALFVSGKNERLQKVCDALYLFFEFTGRWDEALTLNQQAEVKAASQGEYYAAGARAYGAGWIHRLRREAKLVLDCAERAAAYWEKAQATAREWSGAAQLRGFGHLLQKDYRQAIAALREALDLDLTISDASRDVVADLVDLANAESLSGDNTAAERDYCEALRVASALQLPEEITTCKTNIAALAVTRRDWPQAEALAREALKLAEDLGRQELIGQNLLALGVSLLHQRKRKAARSYVVRALHIFQVLGMVNEEAMARSALRQCELTSKDLR